MKTSRQVKILLQSYPSLKEKRIHTYTADDIQSFANATGLRPYVVRKLLYLLIFNRAWHLKLLLDPANQVDAITRHKAQILLEAKRVHKALLLLSPPKPKVVPVPAALKSLVLPRQRQHKQQPVVKRKSVNLTRYAF
jgi:hypothetical protein